MGSAISHIGRALAAALVLFALPAFAEVGVRLVAPPPADAHRHRIEQVRQRLLGRLAEPGAAADVYELEELLAQGGSLERAADLLYRVVESWRTHPHVRALARRTLAEVERQRGRLPRMQAQLAALGVVTDVSVVGPFPNENGEGFARRFGPEEGGGLDAVYEGAGHPVRWRALPGLGGRGAILLEEAFRDGGERTVYVLTELSAPRAMPATLFLGTPGPTRAWLGGKAILSDPDDHPARFDQRAIPLKLEAGKNLLLLKIASRGRWPLVLELRVADAQGKAIPGLRARAPGAGTLPPAERIPAGRVLRGETPLLSELAGVQSARGLEDRARILGARHPFDARARLHVAAAERAARAAPHRVEAQLLAARFQAEDGDARRAWLEKAIAAERPGELFAHAELAQHHLDRGAPWKAIELLAPRLERAPGDWPAHLVWARAWEALGESARARTIVEELLQRFPDEPELHARLAHHALRDGQIDEAVRRLRVGLALRPADRSMASSLATTLAAAGKVRAALDVLAGAERLAVIDLGLLGWRAELLAANGELGAARELLRRALAIAPDAPAHWERLGRIELEFGDAEAA
ncbi:MAG TPA: tetratricopeptide repeat protein, partial [Fredinandcohnia sp.]|nr:tetratricopeptide repeat protein [Fredinandcohnia sp.]